MPHDARAEFSRAAALHQQGQLDEAVVIYRRLIKAHPGGFEIKRLMVFALLQGGRSREALLAARRARDEHRGNPHAHLLLGASLQALGQWDDALAALDGALALDPGLSEAQFLAGSVLSSMGRLADAVARYDLVLAADPRAVEARANRAVALSRLGRAEEALRDGEALVVMQPWEAKHWITKAGTLLELGRFAEAAAAGAEAVRLAPNLADGHLARGQGLLGLADLAGARAAFTAAVACAPERAGLRVHLARIARRLNAAAEAREICDAALARDPHSVAVLQERAEVRRDQGDLTGALADIEAALAEDASYAPALATKARLLADLGEGDQVEPLVAAALAADPASPAARYLRATEDLARARWGEGWEGYESRAHGVPPPYVPPPFARWDGRERPEELVVVGEQGTGDLLLFGRLLRILADRGIPARLLTEPCHVPLLSRIDARIPVVGDLAAMDLTRSGLRWAPLASLPLLVAPDPALWPKPPYLTAAPDRIARWRHVRSDRFTIGICWHGDPSPTADGGRSAPLEAFAPLAAIDGVELVSLQRGAGREELAAASFAGRIVRLDESRDRDGTFVDTAGILQHLDLVVTVDAATAHLAGARGRPAFVALKAGADWRWGDGEAPAAFYPAARLFRQRRSGEWEGVFTRMVAAVRELMRQAGA